VILAVQADQNNTITMFGSLAMPKRFVRNALIIVALSSWITAALADDYADGFLAASSGDYKVAYAKWHELAEQGDANAQFNLGLMYHSGLQVPFNEKKAVYWYKRAADGGNHLAQEYMAVGYQEGWFGLPHDQAKAHYWYQRLNGEIDTAAVDYSSGK
jgi:TPR repeat protein